MKYLYLFAVTYTLSPTPSGYTFFPPWKKEVKSPDLKILLNIVIF